MATGKSGILTKKTRPFVIISKASDLAFCETHFRKAFHVPRSALRILISFLLQSRTKRWRKTLNWSNPFWIQTKRSIRWDRSTWSSWRKLNNVIAWHKIWSEMTIKEKGFCAESFLFKRKLFVDFLLSRIIWEGTTLWKNFHCSTKTLKVFLTQKLLILKLPRKLFNISNLQSFLITEVWRSDSFVM